MGRIHCYRGALVGLATGDALGTTLEPRPLGRFEPITDLVGGGPFALQPGQRTDDTAMAPLLAKSLIECQGFDVTDQMQRDLPAGSRRPAVFVRGSPVNAGHARPNRLMHNEPTMTRDST
jgi:ADP-ribosylglycohydrolase